jgi:cytochrome c
MTVRRLAAVAILVLAGCGEEVLGPSVLDGRYTDAQADRGLSVYFEHCVHCHGALLEGDGDIIPSIGDRGFQRAWGLYSLGALYEYVSMSMPDDKGGGSLTLQQYADVVAFMLRVNGYPAGAEELVSSSAALRGIRIVPVPLE